MANKDQNALPTVLLRNIFYRDAYKRVIACVFIALIIDVILLVGVIYKSTQVPAPQYFAATPDGRIIQQHPLTDPVLSDAQVLAWVSNVTQALYRMDYVHWQDQLQLVANYFTPAGWRNYVSALKASNNLNALTQFKMVTKVQLTGVV